MSDIRFNQWLHNSGTGGVSQVDGGHVGIGTTNPLIPVGSGNTAILNVGVVTANSFYGDGSNLSGIVGGGTSLSFNDNIGAYFGNSQDLKIYHDGNHSYVDDQGTGNLRLRSGTLEILNLAGNKTSATFSSGGGQTLNFNNSARFTTTNTGATVTGAATITGEIISNNGTIRRNVSDSSFTVSGDTASNTGANINLYGASHASLANVFRVRTGSTERLRITSGGQVCIGTDTAVRALTIKQPGQIHLESTDTGNWLGIQLKGSSGTNNYNAYFGMLDSNGNFFIDNGSNGNDFVISQSGVVTIGGEVHIGSKLVHDGDTDTHINFSSNTIVTTAGNVTKMNVNNTMVEINGVVQRQGGRTYSTNSTSTWTTILSFSNASTNGFFFECAVSENNYSTIYKVGGSPTWNSCYFTSDHAGDSNHAHSSDITFRVLNDSGTKRLQFKAVSYTTTRYLYAINVWVRTGYVNWS